ncbi:MAG: RHS repeat-associated core domain-containing protein [Gemmatales bacterium]|nr:RHS repeat-associated core domain-containing protein [Gemmatales bacterium]
MLRDRDTYGDGTLDERLYVVQDANDYVTALFHNAGNVVERYVYDPFGSVTVLDASWNVLAGSAFAWVYLHQGGRYDFTSGLYHFRFRDYSPTLGRWTSLDPIGYAAGDVNLYRTVFNAPTVFTDPSGQAIFIPVLIIGGLLLAGAGGTLHMNHTGLPERPAAGRSGGLLFRGSVRALWQPWMGSSPLPTTACTIRMTLCYSSAKPWARWQETSYSSH